MANTIRIKRRPASGSAGEPSSLFNGELAFNENDNILYYGYGSGVGGPGVATSRPAIGGSGLFSVRGGTNASGVWPIGITGNSATVTNGVYTTGDQNIGGAKTFSSIVTVSGNLSPHILFKSANAGNYGNIVFDGVNYDGAVQSSYIASNTGNMRIAHGQKIQLDSAIEVKAANTTGNSVGYFAVFDTDPASSLTTLKSVSKSVILDDIGAATSGLDIIAGSGLVGGGTLSQNRTFDIGQGDGVTVSADSIAVNSTVVRTTGNQTVGGQKTFSGTGIIDGTLKAAYSSAFNYNVIFSPTQIQLGAGDINVNLAGSAFYDPNGVYDSTKEIVNKAYVTSTLTGNTFTAGSGLVGGGTLIASRTFDIGQGDGISVSADSIAVDSTVVRTTGTQVINGSKTFGNNTITFGSGIVSSGTNNIQAASTASTPTQFAVFTSSPNSSAQTVLTRTPSEVKTDIGLSNVTNDAQVKKLASSTSGYVPTWNGTTGDALAAGYSVETTLTGGTGALPRADAVKTYVDNMIVSGIATNDAMIFKGAIDCSTNPNYPAADRGWTYKVSVAGKIGGASGPVVEVNDTLICTTDGTSAGTHAAVGSNWTILQTNIVDSSILVTGPASATNDNFALFDGTTGKIIKNSALNSSSFATAGHVHGNITNAGAIGSTANLPIITTTAGALTTGSFGSTANTFCQGNDSRLSDTRNTTNSITVNNGGAGDNSSFTFNGSAARTISYNSVGAPSQTGALASGSSWNISILGNAATVTSGIYTYGAYADPSWIISLAKSKVGLGNVENTALSTWAGSTNITTLGTIATGTWSATTIAANKGGTGQTSYAVGDLLYADTTSSLAKLADVATGNALLAGGVNTAPSWGKIGLTTHVNGTLPVANGGTNQTSYTDGQLLIGNTTGNTLTKATLTQGSGIAITNGNGSITVAHAATSSLTGAQGSNGVASITVDGQGHVTAVTTATYLTAGTVCAAIVDCTLDGGSF